MMLVSSFSFMPEENIVTATDTMYFNADFQECALNQVPPVTYSVKNFTNSSLDASGTFGSIVIAEPGNTSNVIVKEFSDTSTLKSIASRKKFDYNALSGQVVISGRLMVSSSGTNTAAVDLKNGTNNTTCDFIVFKPDRNIIVGGVNGSGTTVVGTYGADEWIQFIIVFNQTTNTQDVYLSGGVYADGVRSPVKVLSQPVETSAFTYNSTSLPFVLYKNDVIKSYGYWDDLKIYKAPTLDLFLSNGTDINCNSPIAVKFNHPIDLDTLTADKITVMSSGSTAAIAAVDKNYDDPETCIITFSSPLISGQTYTLSIAPEVKDIVGNSPGNTALFTVKAENPNPTPTPTGSQKRNLYSTSTPRFAMADYEAWPENHGDAHVALWNDNKSGACSITIDDNFEAEHDTWLAFSREYGFKFTWFVITSAMYPTEWMRMIAEGQDIQSHTVHHWDMTPPTPPAVPTYTEQDYRDEYSGAIQAINALTGGTAKRWHTRTGPAMKISPLSIILPREVCRVMILWIKRIR